MAKKTFKGGLDSLIENSLGIKKLKGKKTNFKGNPVDLSTEENGEQSEQEEKADEKKSEVQEEVSTETKPAVEISEDDSESIEHLKSVIHDLRHELFLWRNGKINVQIFNQTLHLHNLKYNPVNNEIEEF
jgi:hypothetical protein